MSCAVTDYRAGEAMLAGEGYRSQEIERSAVPNRLEELAAMRKARLCVEAFFAVDKDITVVVAPVARRREKLADGLGEQILPAGGVRARESRPAERLRRDVEDDALLADNRIPTNGAVDAKVAFAVRGRKKKEKVAALAAKCDRLFDRHPRGVLGRLYDACAIDSFHERNRRLVEQRRIAAVDLEQNVVEPEPRLERDDVLDHAQVVVGRTRTHDEILRTCPEIGDVDFRVELFRQIHAADPPSRTLAGSEGDGLLDAAAERPYTCDRRLAGKRLAADGKRRRAAVRQADFIDRLNAEALIRRGYRGRTAEDSPADRIVVFFHAQSSAPEFARRKRCLRLLLALLDDGNLRSGDRLAETARLLVGHEDIDLLGPFGIDVLKHRLRRL